MADFATFPTAFTNSAAAQAPEFGASHNFFPLSDAIQSFDDVSAQGAFASSVMYPMPMHIRDPVAMPTFAPTRRQQETAIKTLKALNAFVAFRTFYLKCPEFDDCAMKQLSNVIAVMWDTDPNKHLWELLAKAWTKIRDQIGKKVAPLRQFFDIMCRALDMPLPDEYLPTFGWELYKDEFGTPHVSRIANAPHIEVTSINTTMSIGNIIRHCQSVGYAVAFNFDGSEDLDTMAYVQVDSETQRQEARKAQALRERKRLKRSAQRAASQSKRDMIKKKRAMVRDFEKSTPPFEHPPEIANAPIPVFDSVLAPINRLFT